MAKFDKRLKNILVKRGCLTTKAAEDALTAAEHDGKSLSQIVVDQKVLPERDLIAAVAIEMKMPPIDVTRVAIEDAVLEALPQDLAKYYGVLPIAKIGDILTLAVSNPFDILKLDDIRIVTGCNIRPVVSTEMAIQAAIAKAYDKSAQKLEELYGDMAEPEVEIMKDQADLGDDADMSAIEDEKSPVVKLVNLLIMQAVKERASDIHIEPMEKKLRIRIRKDGVLHEFPTQFHKKYQNAVTSRIKIMASLDIAEKRVPQDGKFQMKIENRAIDFRVSVLPTIFGEKTVLRILDSSSLALSLDTLGFEESALKSLQKALASPYGMVLVTGPTGSGKTTTLYSSLREVMSIEDNIVTVEDPVEYQLEGVIQVPVNPKRGMNFAAALRSILRQDPDIVMVGEMRDLETIEIAIRAALTGHLVLSTLHTNDAASTITRMIDMGIDPFLITSTVVMASAQRLLRKICGECKEEVKYPEERLLEVGYTEEEVAKKPTFVHGRGCLRCNNGYKGRFAIIETLVMSDKLKRLVLDGQSDVYLKKAAIEEGMVTLRRSGLLNAMRGRTAIEEVVRMTAEDFVKREGGIAGKHAELVDEDVRK